MIREITAITETVLNRDDSITCLIVLAVAASFIGIVALLLLHGGEARQGPRIGDCTSESCKRAFRDLDLLINPHADPCQDFYGHVCHRWQQKTAASSGNPVTFLRYETRELMRHINYTLSGMNSAKPASFALYKVAKFYESCERFVRMGTASVSEALLPFRDYGRKLLNMSTFPQVVRYIVQLSLAQGIHTVLDISLNKFPEAVSLRLLRGQTLSRKMNAKPTLSLKNYLIQLMGEVSGSLGHRINVTAILDIEQKMRKYMAWEHREQRQSIAILGDLTTDMRLNEWLDVINADLPQQHKVNTESMISIDSVDLIQLLLSFFRVLGKDGVIYLFVQILIDGFRFDYLRRVSSNDTESIVSSCLRATQSVMRNTRGTIASQLFTEPSGDTAIYPIFSKVLDSVSIPSAFSWMTVFMRHKADKTLQSVSLYPFNVYSQTPYDEADLGAVSKTGSFPGFFLQMKKRQQLILLEEPPAPHELEIDDAFLMSSDVLYHDQSSSIVAPASLRQEPVLYAEGVPPEYVMGTLGVLLARALLRAVIPINASAVWSPEERFVLFSFYECLHALARTALNVSIDRLGKWDPRDVYIWTQSVRSAFNALKAAYEPSRAAANYDSYWVLAQKTFFRRFCLLSCSVRSEQQNLASRVFCFLPLLNMEEFSNAFDCPYHKAEYSIEYCDVASPLDK
ncbi:hypothetical protein V5799_015880 [Amblyomma americanum]|uniref:Peptidase M13 N-terminal domain-containing protein n=1 Tax=Amblyomma americanum TaxID=6943 RepID=A0AAQ4F6P6_AMBAM